MSKLCKKCNETKPLDEFFRDANCSDGRHTLCKKCKTSNSMNWRANNKEKYNEQQRNAHRRHKTRNRLYRYRIDESFYKKMLTEQNNKCAICGKGPSGVRPLAIDHDHMTGKVRGLLCYGCNRLMCLLDNPELLEKSLAYRNKS